jgi:hypothetical protein
MFEHIIEGFSVLFPHPPAWLEELVDKVTIAATAVKTLAMTMVRDLARRASTLDFGMEE